MRLWKYPYYDCENPWWWWRLLNRTNVLAAWIWFKYECKHLWRWKHVISYLGVLFLHCGPCLVIMTMLVYSWIYTFKLYILRWKHIWCIRCVVKEFICTTLVCGTIPLYNCYYKWWFEIKSYKCTYVIKQSTVIYLSVHTWVLWSD